MGRGRRHMPGYPNCGHGRVLRLSWSHPLAHSLCAAPGRALACHGQLTVGVILLASNHAGELSWPADVADRRRGYLVTWQW